MTNLISKKAAELANLNKSDIDKLIKISRNASEKAGDLLLNFYGKLEMIKDKGRIGDLVTNADLEAEKLIIDILEIETPDISILAEENGGSEIKDELVWCVDPLDGTTNFAHSYPLFASSIGLIWNGNPILGSITVPYLKETYYGDPINGSFCNGNSIKVSTTKKLIDSLLCTGFAYDRHTRLDNNFAEFCWLTNKSRGVRRGGAAAVDLAFLASGKLDGYWERGLAKWDLAAGVAIAENAGAFISDYQARPFDISSGRVIASTIGIKEELINELNIVNPLEGKFYGNPEISIIKQTIDN